jgi:hypothetical protein
LDGRTRIAEKVVGARCKGGRRRRKRAFLRPKLAKEVRQAREVLYRPSNKLPSLETSLKGLIF